MYCKHQWKILSEKTTESKMEHMRSINFHFRLNVAIIQDVLPLTSRKFIQILVCEKCGKIKQFVTNI